MKKATSVVSYIVLIAVLLSITYYLFSMNWPRGEYASNAEIKTFANRMMECPDAVEQMKSALTDGRAISKIRLIRYKEKCTEEFSLSNRSIKSIDVAREQLRAFEERSSTPAF